MNSFFSIKSTCSKSVAVKFFLISFRKKNNKFQSFIQSKFIKNNYKLSYEFTFLYRKILFLNTFFSLFSLKKIFFKNNIKKYKSFFFFLKNIFYLNSFILHKNFFFLKKKNTFLNTSLYSFLYFYFLSFKVFSSSNFILCKIQFYCNELFLVHRFSFKFFLKFGLFFHLNSIFFFFNPLKNTFLSTLYVVNSKINFFTNFISNFFYCHLVFSKNFFIFYVYILYTCFFQVQLKNIFKQLLIALKFKKKRCFLKRITKLLSKKEKKKLIRYYYKLSKKNVSYTSSSAPFKYLKLIAKDQKKRILFHKIEQYKYLYNYLFSNSFYSFFFKNVRPFIFSKLNKCISIVKVRNLCIITGSSRSIFKKYKISRITFRD